MTKTIPSAFWLCIPVSILIFLIWLTQSALYLDAPNPLTVGITLDFIITIPFIYALVIWKSAIPKFTILSVMVFCIIIASYMIPSDQIGLLTSIKTILVPLIEFGILGFVSWQARAIIREYKQSDKQELDFFELISEACRRSLPGRVGGVFATEIAVFYYVFFAPRKQELKPNEYTYFKKSGIKTLVGVVLGVALCELFVMHFLVQKWSVTVAWVLTFFSAYACLQIIALLRSMNSRLFSIDSENKVLKLKYGFVNYTTIPLDIIKEVRLHRRSLPSDKRVVLLSPLDLLDSHNIIIDLTEEHTLHRIYGLKKQFKSIAIYVDEKDQFVNQLNGFINA